MAFSNSDGSRRPTSTSPKIESGSETHWLAAAATLATAFCLWWSRDLLAAWQFSPLDRFGWLAFSIWISPLIYLAAMRGRELRPTAQRMAVFVCGVACGAVGSVASLHALQHVGLALALAGWLGFGWGVCIWLGTSICWMPAFGWCAVRVSPPHGVLIGRILVAGIGATLLMKLRRNLHEYHERHEHHERHGRSNLGALSWLVWSGLTAVLVLSLGLQLAPLSGSEERLAAMQIRGEAFDSRGVALAPTEAESLGGAIAVRRLYRFGEQRVLTTVIDGTHNRHAIHDPLYCFTGAGWRITKDESIRSPWDIGGAVRRVHLQKQGRTTEVVYWFSDGEEVHASISRYWLQATIRRLTRGWLSDEPLLIMLQSYDAEELELAPLLSQDSPFVQI